MAVNSESSKAFEIQIVLITPYNALVIWNINGPVDKIQMVLSGPLPPSLMSSSVNSHCYGTIGLFELIFSFLSFV